MEDTYRAEMEAKSMETLKLLTIAPKCITLELEKTMTNPEQNDLNEDDNPCSNCSVCDGEVIGRKFNRDELKNLLFIVFTASVEKGGIEGKRAAKAIAKAMRKRSHNCKNMFNF